MRRSTDSIRVAVRPLLLGEEPEQDAVDLLRALERRKMRRARDRLLPCARYRCRNMGGDSLHIVDVLIADQDERGAGDLAEALVDGWVERALLEVVGALLQLVGADRHRADEIAQTRIDVVGAAARPVDPEAKRRLGRRLEVARLERGFLGGPAGARVVG